MRVPVLLYHSVAATADPRFAEWAVTPEQFATQMDVLAAGGYRAVTVAELTGWLWDRRGRLPQRVVAITFDDGFEDFYRTAWTHLRRNGLTATVFVTTGRVGSTSAWLAREGEGDRPLMTWAQLDEIAAGGIELGAHGHTHVQLDTVSRSRAVAEIEMSQQTLSAAVGPVASFAYPHGYHNRLVRHAVRRAGFVSACAVGDGLAASADDRFALTRAVVRRSTTIESFTRILDLCYPGLRRRPIRRAAWRVVRRAGLEPQAARLRALLASGQGG